MGASYIGDLLEAARDAALDALDITRTGHPEPSRVLVAHGPPVVDTCTDDGLLAVYLNRAPHVHPRSGGRTPVGCLVTVTAEFVIELWRCAPTVQEDGSPWPVATYEDSALDLATDLWCLLGGLYGAWKAGGLDPGQPCKAVEFGAATPLGPLGGAAGWRVPYVVHLSDQSPAGIAS